VPISTSTPDGPLVEVAAPSIDASPLVPHLQGRALVHRWAWAFAKRAFDIIVAALVLVVLAPVFGLVAVLISLDSPGPLFFACDRVGYLRRPLRMLKFRKMCDQARGSPLTLSDDERLTSVGGWLTRHKLDELPQFWHVFRGDMSLIGPRPESEVFVSYFDAEYERILMVRPGIFGLSQLAFAREGQILDRRDPLTHYVGRILPQKVGMDCFYVDHQGLLLDARILFWSVVAVVLGREVAVHRGSGRLSLRRR
jgi:lipopolysaccharide/colanic/teichoic acid biosynthesis glycosyltransferase